MDLDAPVTEPLGDELVAADPTVEAGKVEEGTPAEAPGKSDDVPSEGFKDLEAANKGYAELRTKWNERDAETRDLRTFKESTEGRFSRYGGAEKVETYLQTLASNPNFTKWATDEKARLEGKAPVADNGERSKEEQEARNEVQGMIDQAVDAKIASFNQTVVNPHIESVQQRQVNAVFSEMDIAHPNWREQRETMDKIAELFSPAVKANPTLDNVEMLYHAALQKNGKLQSPEQIQKDLMEKKRLSTDSPSGTGAPGAMGMPEGGDIGDAFEQALKFG